MLEFIVNQISIMIDFQWGFDYLINQTQLDQTFIKYLLNLGNDFSKEGFRNEEVEWVRHYFEAALMYTYWRLKHEKSSVKNTEIYWHQRLIGDIIQGQHLEELDSDNLINSWMELYNQLHGILMMISQHADIMNLHFVFDRVPPRIITVNCNFH